MSDDTRALADARIPFIYHKVKLQERFPTLHAHVISKHYSQDRRAGIGLTIICEEHDRAAALALFARAAVLTGDRVAHTNLTHLLEVVEERHTEYDALLATRALFVAGFYDPSVEFPFTPAERRVLEQFLRERVELGLRNYYAMGVSMKEAVYWSGEFRGLQCQYLREISV